MGRACTIFYSWQSDVKSNRDVIRKAFNYFCEKNTMISFTLDESTRNVPGMPDITNTIYDKIRNCDLFIADLTCVGKTFDNSKLLSNSNVMMELGYAKACLGEDRLICICNSDCGLISELPFDINHSRITSFSLQSEEEKSKNDLRKGAATKISDAISLTASILIQENRLYNPGSLSLPKFQILMEKSEPLLKSLVLQLVNVSESCVSEICVESFEVLDEKGNHIQEFDVANCHITPTYLREFENCYLKFKNDELLDHIGAHPETIIILFTCEDQMYNKYRFEISGAIDYWRWEKKGTKEVNPKWKVKFIGIY